MSLAYSCCASSFPLFLRELEEAAIVDGAGRLRIYWQVLIPVNRNALIALGIFVFLHSWNDLFWPLIVLSRVENRTLPVGLAVLAGAYGAGDSFSEPALIMAASSMSSIPVLIVYVDIPAADHAELHAHGHGRALSKG